MRTVSQARREVLEQARCLSFETVPLDRALGFVLAQDVMSDIDSPAADKSMVDGYALKSDDLRSGQREFQVIEQVIAGDVPKKSISSGVASQVMTGVAIPTGATCVVKVEDTERLGTERIRVNVQRLADGQNILRQGVSIRTGDVVLRNGHLVRPYEIGLLAEVGATSVRVVRRPTVAVVSTGNELVPVAQRPGPGQLRNSNGPMLVAQAERLGAIAMNLGVARDVEAELRQKILAGLQHDLLVMSGGVSAGVMDLVPSLLSSMGVRQVFHKVQLKPGKPIWFGVFDRGSDQTLVFGLPGNPVSSLVCFELFVRPAIESMRGQMARELSIVSAKLQHEFLHRGDRPTFFPARIVAQSGEFQVHLLPWQGSADLRILSQANGLAEFEPGDLQFKVSDSLNVRLLDL